MDGNYIYNLMPSQKRHKTQYRPALLPAFCVERRGGVSPFPLLCLPDDVIMAMAVPDLPAAAYLLLPARACSAGCGSPPVPLVLLLRSSRLTAPLDRVGERGALASRFIAARRGLPRAGGGALLASWVRGAMNVSILWMSFQSVDCSGAVGYSVSCALSRVR